MRNFLYILLEVIRVQVKQLVAKRFIALMKAKRIKPNELATRSGVTPSTVYSMLDPSREDIYMTTVKKLCDGLGITLGEFFGTPEFDALEQEIK